MTNYQLASYNTAIHSSSRLEKVVSIISQRIGNGCGKLVFCHFREEIDEIVRQLRNKDIERVAVFDGRITSKRKRSELLKEKYDVLLLQIDTGCEGLKLQENYSEVYFVTPHWNPYVEEQAIARCHRFGQMRCVEVFRFYMQSNTFHTAFESQERVPYTFDQLVVQRQQLKTILAQLVLGQAAEAA